MANKKLKVELDVETSKAKGKVKRDLADASTPSGSSSTVSTATKESAASVKRLGDAAKETQINMKSAAKAFTGIAVGLAANYAAKNMEAGSTGQKVIEYGASAVSGASMGAMVAGPIGAAVGGLAGVLKTYLDREGERKQMSKDFELGEARYAATKRDIERFRDLTEVKRGGGTAAQLPVMREIAGNFKKSAEQLVEEYRKELAKANPDKERLTSLQTNIGYTRQMADKYDSAIESLEDRGSGVARAGMGGIDALSKIGGGFGSSDGMSAMKRLQEEGNRSLKQIADNTRDGGARWQ